jgi:Zn-dependent M28 family amino/carboxypeptidase
MVGSQTTTITTRGNFSMFSGQENALAYPYILQTLQEWYPHTWIEEDEYHFTYFSSPYTWKNLVLTLPGETRPHEMVILSAHLDSTSPTSSQLAPGADDNAGGAAALLEAARVFQTLHFERTIRLIWFTGEELGLVGSSAYMKDHPTSNIVGVINMDMFSYDSDNDHCFELHVGTLPQSDAVGQCFAQTIAAHQIPLKFDYINSPHALSSSDHGSFWAANVGAVEVGENFLTYGTPGGCVGADQNPNYHKATDTIEFLNLEYGFAITQAALATVYAMAGPVDKPFIQSFLPLISR